MVVRVKLYPESAASPAELIAGALWDSEHGRRILGTEPEATPASVIASLRRLARLRPMLLAVEDLHLLEGSSLAEFATILNALSDEVLPLLALARPPALAARSVLERWLTGTIELHGLAPEEIAQLWRAIFGVEPESAVIADLHEATGGNTLALRSALRGALQARAIVTAEGETDHVGIDRGSLAAVLRHNVELLSEGMAVHLNERERAAAARLAMLGEVFAIEAADMLLGDRELLEMLAFRGIVSHTPSPPSPLHGPTSSELPFTFTHTLLHRHLAERAPVEPDRLLAIIVDDLPLYSILPFRLLGEHCDALDAPPAQVHAAVDRMLGVALRLHAGPHRQLADDLWMIAGRLSDRYEKQWSAEEKRELELMLVAAKTKLMVGEIHTDAFALLVGKFLSLTEDPDSEQRARYRLLALRASHAMWYQKNYPAVDPDVREGFLQELARLVERFPSIRFSHEFREYLQTMAQAGQADMAMVDQVEKEMHALLAEDVSDRFRADTLRSIAPFLFESFTTRAERDEKVKLLARVEEVIDPGDLHFLFRKINFLEEGGEYDRVKELIDRSLQQFHEYGMEPQALNLALMRLRLGVAFGLDLEVVEREARTICDAAPESISAPAERFTGLYLAGIGMLRGDVSWGDRMVSAFGADPRLLTTPERALIAIERGGDGSLAELAHLPDRNDPVVLISGFVTGECDADGVVAIARESLRHPIVTVTQSVAREAVIALVERIGTTNPEILDALRGDIAASLGDILGWFAGHELHAFMEPLIERYGGYLTAKELKGWRSNCTAIGRKRRAQQAVEKESAGLHLSMFGQVVARSSDGGEIAIRGGRLRTVLGLLVADRMLRKPLEHREFCYIAAGSDDTLEPENARKTMNNAIFRLRETLGEESILTDGETPRLNAAAVQVDLLEAHALLDQAAAGAREGSLMRAVPAMRRALELARGEVPFPSLYEEFFEALREDFENRLRSTAIDIITRLLRAGDPATAEELLRPALEAIPEDEELSDLLHKALTALGRRAEAAHMKIRESLAEE
jgi:hypothetical protein